MCYACIAMLTDDNNELLTVREVARYCRLHEMTVRRHIKEGRLRAIRIGRSVRIPREELGAYAPSPAPTSIDDVPLTGLMIMKNWPKIPRSKKKPFTHHDPSDPDWPGFSLTDAMWKLVGIGEGPDDGGIARDKYRVYAQRTPGE
jgi:excisionase family DNA binding protein